MADNKHKINLVYEHIRVTMGLERTLNPTQQMTGLKYAVDQLKE